MTPELGTPTTRDCGLNRRHSEKEQSSTLALHQPFCSLGTNIPFYDDIVQLHAYQAYIPNSQERVYSFSFCRDKKLKNVLATTQKCIYKMWKFVFLIKCLFKNKSQNNYSS